MRKCIDWLFDVRIGGLVVDIGLKAKNGAGEKEVPKPGFEPGTLRSSVVRSPNWAIPAS